MMDMAGLRLSVPQLHLQAMMRNTRRNPAHRVNRGKTVPDLSSCGSGVGVGNSLQIGRRNHTGFPLYRFKQMWRASRKDGCCLQPCSHKKAYLLELLRSINAIARGSSSPRASMSRSMLPTLTSATRSTIISIFRFAILISGNTYPRGNGFLNCCHAR